MKDFFISYNKADRAWAEWIAWQLEEAAFTVAIQAWDFRPGGNFVLDMQRAASECTRTIAVVSPDYLSSAFAAPEWAAAFVQDPTGVKGTLLTVRVRECEPKGLLSSIVYVDLVGLCEDEAKARLLAGINRERAKPATAPQFPGARTFADKPAFPGSLPAVWSVQRPRNPHFVGRDALLAEIRQTLLSGQAAALTALHGMGGVGKTQLAAEYAYAHRADYSAVWWLNAETDVTLTNDLAKLAQALDLPEKDAREIPRIVSAVLHWLDHHRDWLLIYDNATDAAAIKAYLPAARNGHILLTSRDPNWGALAQKLEVKTLDADAGAQFLLERTGQTDATAARELTLALDGLPLALEQAGAYCEAKAKPLADYLPLFHERAQALLSRHQPADYPATVATTWEISFTAAQQTCPAAADLLNLLAFCAPEPLPLSVLREGVEHLPEQLAATVADELAFDEAIAALRRYSLLARENDHVTLHRLVQLVARERLTEEEKLRWAEAALLVVNAAFPEGSSDVRTWKVCEPLLPHAQAVTTFAERLQLAPEFTARLVNQIGLYLWGRGQFAEAQATFERAVRLYETAFGPDHPYVAVSVNNLGEVLRNLGDLVGARQCCERALRIDEAAFGPDHSNVARGVNNLGIVLRNLGDLAGARQCCERALHLAEAAFGPNHHNVATSLNNLGSVLKALGELARARQCFERALRLDEAAFGSVHPNVARDVNNLASVLKALGDLMGARQCAERAYRIFTATLGAEHPTTITVRKNLESLD